MMVGFRFFFVFFFIYFIFCPFVCLVCSFGVLLSFLSHLSGCGSGVWSSFGVLSCFVGGGCCAVSLLSLMCRTVDRQRADSSMSLVKLEFVMTGADLGRVRAMGAII